MRIILTWKRGQCSCIWSDRRRWACEGRSWELLPNFCQSHIATLLPRLRSQSCCPWDTLQVWGKCPFREVDRVTGEPLQSKQLLLNDEIVTSNNGLDKLNLHVAVPDPEGRKVGIGVFHLLFVIVVVHVSYIYIQINICVVSCNIN